MSDLKARLTRRRKGIGGDGDTGAKKEPSVPPAPIVDSGKRGGDDASASPFALDKIGGLQAAMAKHEEARGEAGGDWSDDD